MPRKNDYQLVPPPPPIAVPPGMLSQALTTPYLPFYMQAPGPEPEPMMSMHDPMLVDPAAAAPARPFLDSLMVEKAKQRIRGLDEAAKLADDDLFDFISNKPSAQNPTPLSPTQQKVNDLIEEQLLALAKPSRSERFNSGYAMGQKIGGTLALILGAAKNQAGAAIGTARAAQGLTESQRVADAAVASQRQAHNDAVAKLSQIWERMSPSSRTNMQALATGKLKQEEEYTKELNNKRKTALDARVKAEEAARGLMTLIGNTTDKEAKLGLEQGKAANEVANTASLIENRKESLGLQERGVATGEGNLEQRKTEFAAGQRSAQDKKGLEATETKKKDEKVTRDEQAAAQKEVATLLSTVRKEFTGVNASGMPKFPGAKEYFKNNPAQHEYMRQLFKRAGMETSPEQAIDAMSSTPAPQAASGGGSPLEFLFPQLKGATPAAPAATTAPAKAAPMESITAAHDELTKELGREPTKDELKKRLGL